MASETGAALDREQLNDTIGALQPRVFLYHNIHNPPPIGFMSRWAMSYLKGPLTKPQIRKLVGWSDGREVVAADKAAALTTPMTTTAFIPQLAPTVAQYYLPPNAAAPDPSPVPPAQGALPPIAPPPNNPTTQPPVYVPHILGLATVTFDDRKTATRHSITIARLLAANESGTPLDWASGKEAEIARKDLANTPLPNARYAELPNGFGDPQKLAVLQKGFVQYLYLTAQLSLRKNATLKVIENPTESERDFRQRCAGAARAGLDAEQQKIKTQYAKQLDKLAERLQKEQSSLTADQKQLESRKHEELWTNIESIAAFLGIGRAYRPLSTATRKRRQSEVTKADIEQSQATIQELQEKLETLRKEMDADLQASREKWVAAQDDSAEFKLVPRKSDIHVEAFGIGWRVA